MKKDFFSRFALVLMLGFVLVTLSGCETFLEVMSGFSDGLNESSNSINNSIAVSLQQDCIIPYIIARLILLL